MYDIINATRYHLGGILIKNTVQKSAVLDALMYLDHPTADEIYSSLHHTHPFLSRATIYRILNRMVEEGEILHLAMPQGPDRFDITISEHQHCRCVRCGKVFDVKLSEISDIHREIERDLGFSVLRDCIVFEGLCPDCNKDSAALQD